MALDTTVRSSTRLWSEECNRVDAAELVYSTEPGAEVLAAHQPYDRAYEFFSGRKFYDKRNPYA